MSGAVLLAVGVCAAGTYALRALGVLLASRVTLPESEQDLVGRGTVVLLLALVATSTLFEGGGGAGAARPAGVLVAGVLAWRRVPFVAVVLVGAGTAAALRAAGVP
ncbi:AzlD domain-containing protein [Kineococcus terrestris]|uniref:AzlD domain-containing protein n=1 Tax=Kineococcus terrestris TaxID=2044856 RepID=UPI0034DB361E